MVNVTAAVMVLMSNKTGKVPKDRSWKAAKIMMGKVDSFLDELKNYDKENIPEVVQKAVQPYLDDKDFDADFVRNKSLAASGLCAWVRNIMSFYTVFCDVEPKRLALEAANEQLRSASEKLRIIQNKIVTLEEALGKLTAEFEAATAAKLKCQQEADETNKIIELANRLVGGLASENVRWAEAVENFKVSEKTLAGDVLLTCCFLSYVGCFTKRYRTDLMEKHWMPFLNQLATPILITENLDPLSLLVDGAVVATWNNEGLPSDRMSTENATILTAAERWPLMIDPQLQGIKWIKNKYGQDLVVVRLGQRGYLDTIERAISSGETVLIENIEESVDPVLDPLLGRNTIKKGRAIKLGDKEVEYSQDFRLLLHTKLANPHYKPEMQAQTTLINFTVTRDGLEDQLLAAVVSKERPDLEKLKADLTRQQNEFKITLKELEDSLLARLSAAEGNFLGDYALVENLETTKRTATEIEEKVEEAKVTEVKINEARELYRPAAARASLLYFILNDLNKISPMYQFSLKVSRHNCLNFMKMTCCGFCTQVFVICNSHIFLFSQAFSVVFEKAIDRTEAAEEIKQRVENLTDCITFSVFTYTGRGLFERDKLIFTAQMAFQVGYKLVLYYNRSLLCCLPCWYCTVPYCCLQILITAKEVDAAELEFLLRFPVVANVTSPVDFLTHTGWGGIKVITVS